LQQIHNGTNQTIELDIYQHGFLTNADGAVLVNIVDADTPATVLVSSASAFNSPPVGRYSYTLSGSLTATNRVLQVTWSYSVNGQSMSQKQFAAVVTPYALVSDIVDYYKIGSNPSDPNYYSEADIVLAEQIARTQINNYTNLDFGKRYDSQEMFGSGSDALELTERMLPYSASYDVAKVYQNGRLVIDYTQNPVYNVFGYNVELTPTGKALRIKVEDIYADTRYDNQVDPTILYYGSFRANTRYSIEGNIGYNYVPQDIKLCAMLLCGDLLSNDAAWRNKYLKKVSLAEVSFDLAAGAFNGTGNVIVDGILDQWRNFNLVVI
jgi:hypothetical protein